MLCEQGTGCDECLSCRRFESDGHPDFVSIYPGQKLDPDDKGDSIQIKAIRRLVLPRATTVPSSGKRVVVLIREAERMLPGAADALLKTLEEPPPWMRFLLTTENADRLPSTIVSRCSPISVGPVAVVELAQGLVDKFEVAEEEAKRIAAESGGHPGRAFRLLQDRQTGLADEMVAFASAFAQAKPIQALALGESFRALADSCREEDGEKGGRLAMAQCVDMLARFLRDVMHFSVRKEPFVLEIPRAAAFAKALSERAPVCHWTASAAAAIEARNAIFGNATVRLQIDALFTRVLTNLA